jgi:hypothetical protein
MKKILVSLMLLVMTALSAHAQFEKEVWYVNASLTGLDLSHSKNEGTNFGFALTGGAFVADNVAVLLNFKGNYVEHGMDETSIGAQGRYYFSSCGIYGGLRMDSFQRTYAIYGHSTFAGYCRIRLEQTGAKRLECLQTTPV